MKRLVWGVCLVLGCFAADLRAADIHVGVAWQGTSGMANRVFQGLSEELKVQAPGLKLELQKELGTLEALDAAMEIFEKTKQGMIILRSNGAKRLGQRSLSIPTFIGGCNNPVELGVAQSLGKPKANMTGVTYYIPARVKLETFKRVYPSLNKFVLLVEAGNPSSAIDAAETKADAPGLGLIGQVVICAALDEALAAITSAGTDVSVIIGSQALLMDNAEKLVQAAGTRPVFAYSEKPVEAGALCGVVADDVKLGKILGTLVADVLAKGGDISAIPIQTDPEPKLYLNGRTVERLKLEIPFDLLSIATIVE